MSRHIFYTLVSLLSLAACTHTPIQEETLTTKDEELSARLPCSDDPALDCWVEALWADGDYVEHNGEVRRDYHLGKIEREIVFDDEGRVIRVEEFSAPAPEDSFTGARRSYFDSGKLKRELSFVKGERHGDEKLFFATGNAREKSVWRFDRRQGKFEIKFETGKPSLVASYERGTLDGVLKTFFDNGMMNQEVSFVGGKKQGVESTYFQNGFFRSRVQFKDGLRNGHAEAFDPFGKSIWEADFEEDLLNGKLVCFHTDGKTPAQVVNYRRGKKSDAKFFDEKGRSILSMQLFPDGSPMKFSGAGDIAKTAPRCEPHYWAG